MNLERLSKTSNPETNLKQIHLSSSWVPLESFTYRGSTVDCYEDCIGHQVVFPWRGKVVELGSYNTVYQDDIKMIIDDHLDTITRFSESPELYGSKLTRFQNGSFSDIKLIYRGRIDAIPHTKHIRRDLPYRNNSRTAQTLLSLNFLL